MSGKLYARAARQKPEPKWTLILLWYVIYDFNKKHFNKKNSYNKSQKITIHFLIQNDAVYIRSTYTHTHTWNTLTRSTFHAMSCKILRTWVRTITCTEWLFFSKSHLVHFTYVPLLWKESSFFNKINLRIHSNLGKSLLTTWKQGHQI